MTGIIEFHWSPLYIHNITYEDLFDELISNISDRNDLDWDDVYILFYNSFCDDDISDYFTIDKNSIECEKIFDPGEAAYTAKYECDIDKLRKDVDIYLTTKYSPIIKLSNYIKGLDSNVEKIFTDNNYSSMNEFLIVSFTDGIVDCILFGYEPISSVEELFEDAPEIIPFIEDKGLIKSCLEQMTEDVKSLIGK